MEMIDEKVNKEEPGDLLEKSWFFGNLLDRKTRMSRCYSDPCPSSNLDDEEEMLVGKSYEETYSSIKKLPQVDKQQILGLIRTPSLPEDSTLHAKASNHCIQRGSKSISQASNNNLVRAPSLPTSLEEFQDEESDFSMSKLIRQASLKQSDMLPPRRNFPKGLTQNSSMQRQRPPRKTDIESIKTESPEGMMIRMQHPLSKTKLYKSSNDLVKGLEGFKDLSIKFDNQDDLGSGLQEKKQQLQISPNDCKLKKMKSLSAQAWQLESSSSPIGQRSVEDMKAQIKFWARAVASNVRQEC